ncbi:MAG TPA: DUF4258 domain-containing protein [Patescibacteria group bacterium]|nr:DUF4258 domain-containing protein [Patescibacteria group bacterium]
MEYLDLIFTNHALEKANSRGIKKDEIYETFKHPDSSVKGKNKDTLENTKRFDGYNITVILKKTEKNEWLVLSSWRNPPLAGTRDAKQREAWKKAQKAGFWGKMWFALKQQLGIS